MEQISGLGFAVTSFFRNRISQPRSWLSSCSNSGGLTTSGLSSQAGQGRGQRPLLCSWLIFVGRVLLFLLNEGVAAYMKRVASAVYAQQIACELSRVIPAWIDGFLFLLVLRSTAFGSAIINSSAYCPYTRSTARACFVNNFQYRRPTVHSSLASRLKARELHRSRYHSSALYIYVSDPFL